MLRAWMSRAIFFIVDRIKDMVLRNGYSVYPREIEDVLYTHEQVQSVAVLGVPDERVGEEVVAVVMPRPGADEGVLQAELNALARTRLAAYKYPRPLRDGGEHAAGADRQDS